MIFIASREVLVERVAADELAHESSVDAVSTVDGCSLALAAAAVGPLDTLHHDEMAVVLRAFAGVNLGVLIVLLATSRPLLRESKA
jgi:hypothetical protein